MAGLVLSLKPSARPSDSRQCDPLREGAPLPGEDNSTQVEVLRSYERAFHAGELIFDEGDSGELVFIIQSGEVEITRTEPGGRRLLARLGPSEFFGEMSVVVGEPRTTRATAIGDLSVLEVDAETLEAMCLERPEIAIRIIQRLTTRLIEAERRLANVGVDDAARPLLRILLSTASPDSGSGARIPTTLRALAGAAGLSMGDAHHALHRLMDRRLLKLVDDVLIAPDLDTLATCLDNPT